MFRALVLSALLVGSAACGAAVRWERSGGTEAERQRDETECAAQANRDRSVPAQRIITRSGTVANESIELVTVRDFDWDAFNECMRTRGYARVPTRPPG